MWRRKYYPRKLWYIKKTGRYCVATGTSLSNSTATATVRSADRPQPRLLPGLRLGPIPGPGARPPGLLWVGADAVSAVPSWAIRQLGEFASLPPGKEEKEILKRKVKGRLHRRLTNTSGCSLWTAEGFLSVFSFINWPSRQFARICFLNIYHIKVFYAVGIAFYVDDMLLFFLRPRYIRFSWSNGWCMQVAVAKAEKGTDEGMYSCVMAPTTFWLGFPEKMIQFWQSRDSISQLFSETLVEIFRFYHNSTLRASLKRFFLFDYLSWTNLT
jgi:hypothetical protein